MSIEIPLKSTNEDEVIEIQLNNLPEVDEILSVLENEKSHLNIWMTLAVHYYRQGRPDDLMAILKKATEQGKERDYEGTSKERIACLNALAAYYCMKAEKEKDKRVADELLQNAILNFNRSDNIDLKEVSTWLGKGVLHLLKGDYERANYHFKYALDSSEKKREANIPAILGQADLAYAKKRYQDALTLYKQALRLNPGCPAEVRLGIGQCFFKLGNFERARQAFERTLAINDRSVGALVGLAILELNGESADGLIKGMRLLKRAYELEPGSSMVLNHIANHFFYKGQLDKVHTLALNAFHNTSNDEIKAESCYIIGRTYQRQDLYDQAFQFFFQAVKFNPELLPAQYGLGQMYIYKNQLKQAAECFEKVQKTLKDSYETMKILGSIYAQTGREEKGRELFKQVVTMREGDIEAWIEYGALLEPVDHQGAYDAYKKAKTLLEEKAHIDVPAELWNNLGALAQTLNLLEEAKECYERALKSMEGETDDEIKQYNDSIAVTVRYNMARLHEVMGDMQMAQAMYDEILTQHPNYIDSHLRLGVMMRNSGHIVDATNKFKDALSHNTHHLGVRTLMGNLHVSKGEIVPAQKVFEGIVQKDRADTYAHIALGNIWHMSAASTGQDAKDKMEKYWDRAIQFYTKALKGDPKNLYAANGVGVVLAEKHHTPEARDIFVQVREATGEMPDVWINLAHVYCDQGQYINAIKLYQNCLRKFHNNHDTSIMTYLARAYYKMEKYGDCKNVLQKAYHINPQDQDVLFNLGLAHMMTCVAILRTPNVLNSEISKGVKEINHAIRTFEHLTKHKDPRSRFAPKEADRQLRHCKDLLKQAEHEYTKTKAEEEKTAMRFQKFDADRKEREDKELAKQRRKEEEERRKQEELSRRREEEMRRQEELSMQLRDEAMRSKARKEKAEKKEKAPNSEGDEPKPKKGRKSKKQRPDEDFIDYEDQNQGSPRSPRDDIFGSESEAEYSPKRRGGSGSEGMGSEDEGRRRRSRSPSDSDGGRETKKAKKGSNGGGGRKALSKAIISDSDDSDFGGRDEEPLSPAREAGNAHSDDQFSDDD
eukprot:comp22541_c1_seq1/m.34251 comp22541_c1_seq1/g.34251  ORF comp22541_c1_seq1/g.34251 comp22541_c1_seq1/m.34251 type:complete len:1057 (-) comp22541_c1_seq1:62-3232(-)